MDLDSGLYTCPPGRLEILLAWFTVHWFLGIVVLLFFGWFLMIVLFGLGKLFRG
jgi:hypothetical protein